MLLSYEKKSEIHAQWLTRSIGIDSVIEIIEAAILAKLASAELPEPFDKQYDEIDKEEFGIYGEGQLIAWGNARYAQGAAAQLAEKPVGFVHEGELNTAMTLKTGYAHLYPVQHPSTSTPLYTRKEAK